LEVFVRGCGEIGRRSRLKICHPFGYAGSSPAVRTIWLVWISYFWLALASCSGQDTQQGIQSHGLSKGRIIRISDSEIKSLDPHKFSDIASLRVAGEQFAGLTRLDAAGTPIPALAQIWSTSPNGLIWTFTLRPGAKFSDGTAITADDVARSFARLKAPETASPTASLFSMIESIQTDGPAQVRVTLNAPLPQLPNLLAHPALSVLPMHRIAAKGDSWTDERPLVTSGAYRTQSWQLNARLVLTRNPNWHRDGMVEEVEWRPMEDTLAALRLFRSGGADTVSDFPASRTAELQRDLSPQARISPYLGTYYLAFNTRKAPFSNPLIRQALSLAVERPWLAKNIVASGSQPAWGLIPPALAGGQAFMPESASWSREKRVIEARNLLGQAGYGPKKPLIFNIRFNSSAEHRRIAVALAAMWKDIGVEAKLFNSEASLHFASLRRGDFEAARSGWIADIPAPENFLSVHLSDAGAINYSGFADPTYDQLVAAAMQQRDPAARLKAMQTAEAQLMRYMPILPLYHYGSRNLVASRISGWLDNPTNSHPSEFLTISKPRPAGKTK
jgi:oligopeptide transport system substrate-binding protein